jgi:hypothetical protein
VAAGAPRAWLRAGQRLYIWPVLSFPSRVKGADPSQTSRTHQGSFNPADALRCTAVVIDGERKIRLDFAMGKYLTRRCVGLHVLTLLLVSSFLLATWWQYESALGGNGLSWAYVFEWPAFAIYTVYMWWKLIHDKRTAFDRLWAARQHAAANEFGTPLYQIPGWALDKTLYREVVATSLAATSSPELSGGQAKVLAPPAFGDGHRSKMILSVRVHDDESEQDGPVEGAGRVIDARVTDIKVHTDDELNAYNRYLGELNWRDPPKNWAWRWSLARGGASKRSETSLSADSTQGQPSELPVGDRHASSKNEFDRGSFSCD